ncbi:MAG TPA: aminotransferase class I/II-fold pyridoxal phosphate-dependent enzyme, partial [Candidatus Dormibacteraeota bacterium]|nr:aminotransferase class I/II-fold pyridoxal phosphate-dependent enzyme [Candidatus Dormibacteraeota bacterium]
PEFRLYAETASARFVAVPPRADMSLDLEGIAAALSHATGAVLINSPNNPSGHVLQRDELTALIALLHEHNARTGSRVLLIVDEVYRRLIYPPHRYVSPLDFYEHTVLARSFSKDLGIAGERIGYLVMHSSLASDEARRGLELSMRGLGFVNAPATAQRALMHLAGWTVDISLYRSRRDLIASLARDAGLDFADPQGGLYLWVRSPWEDTLALVDRLASRRVLVIPGVAFGMPTHLRLCFSYPEAKLAMAIGALAALREPVPAAAIPETQPLQ